MFKYLKMKTPRIPKMEKKMLRVIDGISSNIWIKTIYIKLFV